MPRNPTTGVFTRVDNSFSDPVANTVIDPADANSLFSDYDTALNTSPPLAPGAIFIGQTGAPPAGVVPTGDVTINEAGVTAVANASVIAKVLTGFASGAGTVSGADSILSAIQKIDGNDALKAPLASPVFTGAPSAPTAALGTNTTQLATTAFVLANAVGLPVDAGDVDYTQDEAGAVLSPLIRRLHNTLFASEFGAVGDNVTNDRVALQAFLDAIASSGKEGRFDPGKKYFVSGGDLTITNGAGNNGFTLFGFGAQLRTDPTQARTALRITRPLYTPTRVEEARITLIEGLSFDAFQDGNAVWGIDATGVINLILRNLTFTSGADGGTAPSVNYGAIRMRQTDMADPDTGCFWAEIENCRFKGGATGMPNALWLEGAVNAISITQNNFANVDTGIRLLAADRTGTDTANAAAIPNGVRILDNAFEGILDGIKFNGNTATVNKSRSVGLQVQNNRVEAILPAGTAFFNYNGLNLDSEAPPIVGPNYVSSGDTAKYYTNSNNLTLEMRDGAWCTKTVTPVPSVGAFTSVSCVLAYRLEGTMVEVIGTITITTVGTAGGTITIPLPVGTTARKSVGIANEDLMVGADGNVRIGSGAATAVLVLNAGSLSWFTATPGAQINFSFTYEKVAT